MDEQHGAGGGWLMAPKEWRDRSLLFSNLFAYRADDRPLHNSQTTPSSRMLRHEDG